MFKNKLEIGTREINSIQIRSDRDYGWVWEYAQFRFNQSISDLRRTEDKASTLIKYVISVFGLFWVLFVYFGKGGSLTLENTFNYRIVFGLVCLLLSAAFATYCLLPVRTILPHGEEVAIRFINENPEASHRPQGRFGLGLKLCSDFQEQAATRKSWCVLMGFVFLAASLGLLFSGFYLWLLSVPPYGHSSGIAYLRWFEFQSHLRSLVLAREWTARLGLRLAALVHQSC
jgi:hypothetical protein